MATRTSPVSHQQPVHTYTFAEVALKFCDEKVKDIAKYLGYGSFWLTQAIPNAPAELKSFGSTMTEFKNFVAMTEIPKKTTELVGALGELKTAVGTAGDINKASRNLFKKSTGLTNSVIDSVEFGTRFVPIDHGTMTWLKGVNYAATLGGAATSAYEQAGKFNQIKPGETTKTAFCAINFFRDLSYASLGGYGVFCVLTVTPIIPWVLMTMLTSGLTLTILGYFVEKLYDPEGTGKNLNTEALIRNHQALHPAISR